MTFQPIFEDEGWIAGHLAIVHAGEIALHVAIAALIARTIFLVTRATGISLLAGGLFLVNAFAVPAVGYAQAWHEMAVCGLGVLSVFLIVAIRSDWRWLLGIGCAASVLLVKPSAAGIIAMPLLVWLTLDGKRRTVPMDWLSIGMSMAALLITAETSYGVWRPRIPTPMFEHGWLSHTLVQSTAVVGLTLQSVIPYGIAEQFDWGVLPWQTQTQAAVVIVASVLTALWWIGRRVNLLAAFGILWIALAIGPRILVHTQESSGAVVRAPEVIYAQQWYPALPGVIWILVSFTERRTRETS